MRRAFTLVEILVVVAIIAVLAAILFPAFRMAKEAAKKTTAVMQTRQLGAAVLMYAVDYDDYFVPATIYPADRSTPSIWTAMVFPYVKDKELFIAPGTSGRYADTWEDRSWMSIGYNGATAVDLREEGCVQGQPVTTGCEGFKTPASFSQAGNASRIALFATTAYGPEEEKYRGYTFSPYNGPEHPADPSLSPPLTSDRDLVKELGDALASSDLQPIECFYQRTGADDGVTPVVFVDGHVRTYPAKAINGFGTNIIWRFR